MNKASISNIGDSKYYVSTRDSAFIMDTEGGGANPSDTLLAALCGCIGYYTRECLAKIGVENTGFLINAESEVSKDNKTIGEIRIFLDLAKTPISAMQESELLQYIQRCKIYNTLKLGCNISITTISATPES